MTIFECLTLVVQAVSAYAILSVRSQIVINRKQLFSNIITRCIDKFQNLDISCDMNDKKELWKYIDLVSEELFYIQKDYIPKEVAFEWLDGMIDYVPILNPYGKIINEENCIQLLKNERTFFLKNYPRIKSSFKISPNYDFSFIYDDSNNTQERMAIRNKIVVEIYDNIKHLNS